MLLIAPVIRRPRARRRPGLLCRLPFRSLFLLRYPVSPLLLRDRVENRQRQAPELSPARNTDAPGELSPVALAGLFAVEAWPAIGSPPIALDSSGAAAKAIFSCSGCRCSSSALLRGGRGGSRCSHGWRDRNCCGSRLCEHHGGHVIDGKTRYVGPGGIYIYFFIYILGEGRRRGGGGGSGGECVGFGGGGGGGGGEEGICM